MSEHLPFSVHCRQEKETYIGLNALYIRQPRTREYVLCMQWSEAELREGNMLTCTSKKRILTKN